MSLTHRTQAALSVSDTRSYCLLGNSLGVLLVYSRMFFMRNFVYYSVHPTHATCASRVVTLELYRQVVLIWKVHVGFVWLPRYCKTFSNTIENITGDCNFCIFPKLHCAPTGQGRAKCRRKCQTKISLVSCIFSA